MTIDKEKRKLEKQLVVESVEVHEVDYFDQPAKKGNGTTRTALKSRASFPARTTKAKAKERTASSPGR